MRSKVNKRPAANNGWAHIGKIAVGHCSVVLYPQTSRCLSVSVLNRLLAAPFSVHAKHQTKNPLLHNLWQRPPSGTVRSNAVHQVHPKAVLPSVLKCRCILVRSKVFPRTPDSRKTFSSLLQPSSPPHAHPYFRASAMASSSHPILMLLPLPSPKLARATPHTPRPEKHDCCNATQESIACRSCTGNVQR